MSLLLIVSHTPSKKTRKLTDAVARGAAAADSENLVTRTQSPFDTSPDDVRAASGIILGTTENFGYMSGAMKDFFDRIYYPCLKKTEALPYALFVRAGNDGSGAVSSIQRIVTGLKWKEVQPPLICCGAWQDEFEEQAEELGMTLAAGLDAGIF